MKKLLVSSIVITSFVTYSVFQRVFGDQIVPATAPKNIIDRSSETTQNPPTSNPLSQTLPTIQIGSGQTSPPPQIPKDTPIPTQAPRTGFKDGTYTGDAADAYYGNIQVQATITNGRITDVQFLQYPNDHRRSILINRQADPILAREAIIAQSANVDIISGATDSSEAFKQSLQSALDKAN